MADVFHHQIAKDSQLERHGFQVFRGDRDLWINELRLPFERYLNEELELFSNSASKGFSLEDYHMMFNDSDPRGHHDFIERVSRVVPSSVIRRDCKYISNIMGLAEELTSKRFRVFRDLIEFRVVRPNQPDNNLWHRDHWFPYFRPLVNIYLPLAGSTFDSALQVVPGSHKWDDEDVVPTHKYGEGRRLGSNGIYYSTPTIKTCNKELTGHRPDVLEGDFMLFSPLIVHGAGSNMSTHTRFSLEIRLECLE